MPAPLARASKSSFCTAAAAPTSRPRVGWLASGVGRIPEDRHATGVIGDFSVEENLILEAPGAERFCGGGLLRGGVIRRHARDMIERFDIRGATPQTVTRALSGGNRSP